IVLLGFAPRGQNAPPPAWFRRPRPAQARGSRRKGNALEAPTASTRGADGATGKHGSGGAEAAPAPRRSVARRRAPRHDRLPFRLGSQLLRPDRHRPHHAPLLGDAAALDPVELPAAGRHRPGARPWTRHALARLL